MRSSFTYLGEPVIEVIIDDGSVTWNVLPAGPAPDEPMVLDAEFEQPEQDPVDVPSAAMKPTTKKRTLWGFIRGAWFVVFTFTGEAVQYGIDNLTGLNLPPRTGMVVGASLYAAKRAIWPHTTI